MRLRHSGLYSYPLGRFCECLRGKFWNLAAVSIFRDELPCAAQELAWAWDQLLWAYWEPRASRRRVKQLERAFRGVWSSLPEPAHQAFRLQVLDALCYYDPPCYSPALLRIAFGPSLSVPQDEPVRLKPLDNIRLMVRKESRLMPDRADPECPCRMVGTDSLFEVLSRFYQYVGYRTSQAPPLGRPPAVVSLFDHDIDVYDVALIERSLLQLCRRVPHVYRDEVVSQAAKLYQKYPSALLERLVREEEW